MEFNKWDLSKKLSLQIDGIEMDFSDSISLHDHPINFSSMTFHDVIPKEKNNYKDSLKVWNYGNEFQIAKVYSGDQLIFFGIVNATGRLNLFPTTPKTKSIQITDFRRWLSLKQPVDLIFYEVDPEFIVKKLIEGLREPRIKVGNLSFSNTEKIQAYSTFSKTPYQVLKEVVARHTDSLLYFTIDQDNSILINFKSNDDLQKTHPQEIDLDDISNLNDLKITDINLESNIDNYANVVKYESSNVVSNVITQERVKVTNTENYTLFGNIGKIQNDLDHTYMLKDGKKTRVIVLSQDRYIEGKYYDILYTTGKNSIKINLIWSGWELVLGYYAKVKESIQQSNSLEIKKVAERSGTRGDIYKYEKSDDITNANDLLRLCKGDLNLSSTISNILVIESELPLWNCGDTVQVNSDQDGIDGIYLVGEVSATIQLNTRDDLDYNTFSLPRFTYNLIYGKNSNTLVNLFDNQSYKSNPVIDEDVVFETTQTIDVTVGIHFKGECQPGKNINTTSYLDHTFNMKLEGDQETSDSNYQIIVI